MNIVKIDEKGIESFYEVQRGLSIIPKDAVYGVELVLYNGVEDKRLSKYIGNNIVKVDYKEIENILKGAGYRGDYGNIIRKLDTAHGNKFTSILWDIGVDTDVASFLISKVEAVKHKNVERSIVSSEIINRVRDNGLDTTRKYYGTYQLPEHGVEYVSIGGVELGETEYLEYGQVMQGVNLIVLEHNGKEVPYVITGKSIARVVDSNKVSRVAPGYGIYLEYTNTLILPDYYIRLTIEDVLKGIGFDGDIDDFKSKEFMEAAANSGFLPQIIKYIGRESNIRLEKTGYSKSFTNIGEDIPIKQLSPRDRVSILRSGVLDVYSSIPEVSMYLLNMIEAKCLCTKYSELYCKVGYGTYTVVSANVDVGEMYIRTHNNLTKDIVNASEYSLSGKNAMRDLLIFGVNTVPLILANLLLILYDDYENTKSILKIIESNESVSSCWMDGILSKYGCKELGKSLHSLVNDYIDISTLPIDVELDRLSIEINGNNVEYFYTEKGISMIDSKSNKMYTVIGLDKTSDEYNAIAVELLANIIR